MHSTISVGILAVLLTNANDIFILSLKLVLALLWPPYTFQYDPKMREIQMILEQQRITNMTHPEKAWIQLRSVDVDLPEIQHESTMVIAKEKAQLGSQLVGGPCLVDDTSLQFHALGDMPGPYIKWFHDKLQNHGLYQLLKPFSDKTATAICTVAFCAAPHADPVLFTGKVHGTIQDPNPKSNLDHSSNINHDDDTMSDAGFGWDKIFVPNGETKPFSRLSTTQKNALSHRGNAIRQFADWWIKRSAHKMSNTTFSSLS